MSLRYDLPNLSNDAIMRLVKSFADADIPAAPKRAKGMDWYISYFPTTSSSVACYCVFAPRPNQEPELLGMGYSASEALEQAKSYVKFYHPDHELQASA